MVRSVARLGIVAALTVCVAGIPLFAQNVGYLKVKINPGKAGVFVDGKYMGPCSNFGVTRKYQVAAGEHEIKVSDPRYEEFTAKLRFEAGKTVKVSETLKPLAPAKPPFGMLKVKSADKYAAVYVNNRFHGHAGEFNNGVQGLKLNPGTYDVRVEPAGGQPVSEKVTIVEGKTAVVEAK